ncbi:hypothetical protein [Stieleria neptunia]|uniref:hypothetical protein n=1 Tax=Stieleria neptunia TaxID=2527979 RepID=UPI0018D21186|nr:hypothetical protein [Stieleria neptunia]
MDAFVRRGLPSDFFLVVLFFRIAFYWVRDEDFRGMGSLLLVVFSSSRFAAGDCGTDY